MNVENDVNPATLRPGERYKFYLNDGRDFRATFRNYLNNLGVPNSGISLNNVDNSPPNMRLTMPVNFVARITQSGIGPNQDTTSHINSFLGGKRKRKTRKIKRRNKKTKRYRRS